MAIVAVMMVAGFSAFKVTKQHNDPEIGWFNVTPDNSNPTNPNLFLIGGFVSVNEPTGSTCNRTKTIDACQIHLDLEDVAAPETIPGMTLEDAIAAGAKVGHTAYRF